jgi:hypothetical protein
MLHRDGDFEEWQLAEIAKGYIPLYLRNPDDKVCYVEYKDVPSGKIKHIKFVHEEATGCGCNDRRCHFSTSSIAHTLICHSPDITPRFL